jgi:hypothetical protein
MDANVKHLEVGQLVSRKNSDELGLVVDVDNHGVVKVKWDRGRTSYFRPGLPANVKLAESPEKRRNNVGCPSDARVDGAVQLSDDRQRN